MYRHSENFWYAEENEPVTISFTPPFSQQESGEYSIITSGVAEAQLIAQGNGAQKNDSNGLKIYIGKEVTEIRGAAFQRWGGIVELEFEAGSKLKTIGNQAFAYDGNLRGNVTIPASVEYIGRETFRNTGIDSLKFETESKLETIDRGAFLNNNSLTGTVTIPASVDTIVKDAFKGCLSLTKIQVYKQSFVNASQDASLNFFPGGNVELVTIQLPDSSISKSKSKSKSKSNLGLIIGIVVALLIILILVYFVYFRK